MATQTNLGKIGMRLRGAWSNLINDYEYLDVVNYLGTSYSVSLRPGLVPIATLPTNTSYWTVIAEKGGVGPEGPEGPIGPANNIYVPSFDIISGMLLTLTWEADPAEIDFELNNNNELIVII